MKSNLQFLLNERNSNECQLTVRENRLKQAVLHLNTLREEIFKRDTEVAKKNKIIMKLEKEIALLKYNVESSENKMRSVESNVLKKSSRILEDKDRAIEMLKGMIRNKSDRKFI